MKTLHESIHGIIIYSSVEKGSVIGHTKLGEDEPFFILESTGILGSDKVTIDHYELPLLAGYDIKYRGEPVLALFGPSLESVQRRAKSIEIEYQAIPSPSEPYNLKDHTPVVYSWGKESVLETKDLKTFSSTFTFDRQSISKDAPTTTEAYLEDDKLVVEVASQWPYHVLDCVAGTCSRTKKSIIIRNRSYHSGHDETLIKPSIHAAIAANAALITGKRVVLHTQESQSSSLMTAHRETFLDPSGIPVAERCSIEIDQGAYPLFRGELILQMLAGLQSPYPVKYFSAEFTSVESHTPPTHFFGSLGFTEAIYFTESHVSALATSLNSNPSNWRINSYGNSRNREAFLETMEMRELKDLITEVCTASDFSRHHAVYEIQSKSGLTRSPFLNYSRGIGIACGPGISGFSLKSKLHRDAKISITFDNNSVIVNSSFYPNRKTRELWFSVIASRLSVPMKIISIESKETPSMIDTGPEVLSLDVGRSIEMISAICAQIQGKRFQEPLPISESVTAKSILPSTEVSFISQNWGCLTLELEIDTITLQTYARRVVGRFVFSHVMNAEQLSLKFRRVIHETLSLLDIIPVHTNHAPPLIDVAVRGTEEGSYPSSATQSIKGMVFAAYVSACTQALGKDVRSLFETSEHIYQQGSDA